jgi:hypothetical protein
MYVRVSHQPQRGVVVVSQVCGSAECELDTSCVVMESCRSCELPPAEPHCTRLRQFSPIERAEKRMCAIQRDGTSALPLAYVSANHRCRSKRHRSALGKQLQLAEPEAVSRNGSSGAYNRDTTTANSH